MSAATTPFPFPREYFFPPFFTRQTNLTTHHAQLIKWAALVLSYCRHHRIFKLPLSAPASDTTTTTTTATSSSLSSETLPPSTLTSTPSSTTTTTTSTAPTTSTSTSTAALAEDLFHNRKLNRRLSLADAREVIDFLRKDGRAEYVGGGSEGDVAWVYWRTPEEWAGLVEAWVEETANKGSVLTLYELTEGDGTRGTEFHGLDKELLQKALSVLVKRGKAQIFGQEDSQGVKFF